MRKFLTFFSVILFLCCGAVWAVQNEEKIIHDENRVEGAKGEIAKLKQELAKWAAAANLWQVRNDAIGYMGPYMRTGVAVDSGNTSCPKVPPDDPNNPQKEKPPVDYGVQPNLRAVVNMMEKCAKNEYEQEFESFTMPILLRGLRNLVNDFHLAMKYRWPFPTDSKTAIPPDGENELTFLKMANIIPFRNFFQRYLAIIPREAYLVPAGLAVEERQMARRSLKQAATQFLFTDALVNHNLSAENDWRYDRGVEVVKQSTNLREDMQALNFVTIQLLSESARSLNTMALSLGKVAVDGSVRDENNLFEKSLAGQGG